MATMLPAEFVQLNDSYAEKMIFEAFEKSPSGTGAFVLHSLPLAEHGKTRRGGEADFIVIWPRGILTLEVKGGLVSKEEGDFYTIGKKGKERLRISPFQQGNDAAWALDNWVGKYELVPNYNQVVRGHAVILPQTPKPPEGAITLGTEATEEIVFWKEDMGQDIFKFIGGVTKYYTERHTEANFKTRRLTPIECEQYARKIRGEYYPVVNYKSIRLDEQERLTQEQWSTLNESFSRPSVLVEGSAGTGKTVLAKMLAVRSVVLGKKTLFLCFNQKLAMDVEQSITASLEASEAENWEQNITVSTLHGYASRCVRQSEVFSEYLPQGRSSETYDELIEIFAALLSETPELNFDRVIVDEGQDILTGATLEVLRGLTGKKLSEGGWYWFMDPNIQAAVYGVYSSDAHDKLRKNVASLKTLNVNCRNTIKIAKYIQKLLPEVEVGTGKVDGPVQRTFTYSNKKEAISCLRQAIKFFQAEDVGFSDIVVISPLTSSQSVLNDCIKGMSDGEKVVLDGISLDYHTASSFKGLESDGVILVDATLDSSWAEAVTYVAMTRARYGLVAIVEDSKMKAFDERSIAWLEKRDTLV